MCVESIITCECNYCMIYIELENYNTFTLFAFLGPVFNCSVVIIVTFIYLSLFIRNTKDKVINNLRQNGINIQATKDTCTAFNDELNIF